MKNCKEKILFALAVALGVLAVYLRIHTYTTGQDPKTFLLIAKAFAAGTGSGANSGLVIPGWPLALAAVIKLFGIHAAFWTNVPLFALLVLALQALLEELTGSFRRSAAMAAGSALLLLGGYYLNPHFLLWVFRQTPMYLTGILSWLCLVRAVRRQSEGRLWAAVAWLGGALAATAAGVLVRETGVLLLPAMGLYLLATAMGWAGPAAMAGQPARARWFLFSLATAGAAVVCAGGLAALLLRPASASGQVSYMIHMVPTVLANKPFRDLPVWVMLAKIPGEFGWIGFLALLLGVKESFRRRNRGFLFVFLLSALAYLVFDGMLKFHRRFFLSTLFFLAPLVTLGAVAAGEWLGRTAGRWLHGRGWADERVARAGGRAKAAVWGALALWFVWVWAHVCPWGPRTSRADVDRALAALSPWVGPDRPLLMDWRSRYLTDLLEVFTDWSEEVVGPETAASCVRTPELVFARPLDGKASWDLGAVVGTPADSILDTNVRLEEVPGASVFHLGDAAFRLERVLPWVRCRVANPVPPPPEARLFPPPPATLLRVQAHAGAATNAIRVSLLGRQIAGCLHPGYNLLGVPRSVADAVREAGGGELVFEADSPIPEDFSPAWLDPEAPVEMVFGSLYQPSFNNYLSDEFRFLDDIPRPDRNFPCWPIPIRLVEFAGDGRITLPEGMDGDEPAEASWRFLLIMRPVLAVPSPGLFADAEPGTVSVTLSLPDFPDVPPRTVTAPHAWDTRYSFRFSGLPRAPRALDVHVEHDVEVPESVRANPRALNMQLRRMSVERTPPLDSLDLPLGRPWDAQLLMRGFHGGENIHAPNHGRWTDGAAEIEMPLRPGRGYRLSIDFDQLRPDTLPPAEPRLEWNGEILAAEPTDSGLAAVVPAALVGPENTLRILTDTWSPSDFGARDNRRLGIYLRNLAATPI